MDCMVANNVKEHSPRGVSRRIGRLPHRPQQNGRQSVASQPFGLGKTSLSKRETDLLKPKVLGEKVGLAGQIAGLDGGLSLRDNGAENSLGWAG